MTSYKFKPAGHDALDIVKKTYSMPDRKLQLKFEEWLEKAAPEKISNHYDGLYQAAVDTISDLEASIDEVHSLLIQYQDHPRIVVAGSFLSAVYNQQPDNTIVYDVETTIPINYIGCRLTEHKTLILNAQSGNIIGWHSPGMIITNAPSGNNTGLRTSGIIITNAPSGKYTGDSSSGIIITNAPSGSLTGWYSPGTIIINAPSGKSTGRQSSGILLAKTKPEHIGDNDARVLLPEEIKENEELDAYLAELCKTTKAIKTAEDVLAFKKQYGPKPKEKIKQDIKRLLGPQ